MKKVLIGGIAGLVFSAGAAFAGNGDLVVDGNLGVGTPSSTYKFNVLDAATQSWIARITGASNGPDIYLGHNGGYGAYIDAGANASAATYALYINRQGAPYLYVEGDGKVGIGTLSPTYKFNVLDAATQGWIARITGASNGPDIYLGHNGGYGAYIDAGANASAATYALYINKQGAPYLYVEGDGNVGIGTSSPMYKLQVNGSVFTTDSVWQTSDERYKKNVMPVSNALGKLLQLEGVTYEMKTPQEYLSNNADTQTVTADANTTRDVTAPSKNVENKNFSDGKQYGVLAQSVEKVVQELVKTDNKGDKAVNYTGFIPILIEAVKEQQTLITQQKSTLEKQQATLDALQKQLDSLRQMVQK